MYGLFGWDDWTDRIDVGEMLDYINRELSRKNMYLSDSDIRDALHELKDTRDDAGVVGKLRSKLKQDRDSGEGQGFYRSRLRFLVFCFTAGRLASHELARTLVHFFERESCEIVRDKLPLLSEWCFALQQLQGLVSEDKLNKAFSRVASLGPPLFEEWRRPGPRHSFLSDILRDFHEAFFADHDRERDQLILAPRPSPVRRLSGTLYRGRNYLEDPPYPRTTYHSPLVAPLVAPGRDLDSLHFRQRIQDLELARLQREVSNLHFRRHRY